MSKLRADNITNRAADGAPRFTDGVVVTGITTSTTVSATTVNATTVSATTVNATTYVGVPAGFTELDAALFN